ncbi:spore germination protein [Halalkalibacter alkaliphilus]|uniref:Spore germination protein n=1 Tax=Halalkalibacter alkaliphilus TaxID=2917993 RepID=A0A9X2I7H3_9BACI|nr:spore germination protein [Halalkalibacter alkaliphilus]MCL7748314.1 spore germination protein [Halalkalibacter alkaliphilus]
MRQVKSSLKKLKGRTSRVPNQTLGEEKDLYLEKISIHIGENKKHVEKIFLNSSDMEVQDYRFGPDLTNTAFTVHCDTLIQDEKLNYLKALLQDLVMHEVGQARDITIDQIKNFIFQKGVSSQKVGTIEDFEQVSKKILAGNVVIFFDKWNKALSFDALSVESRAVSEPTSEGVVQGPHEGTVENLKKNIGLIRSRLQSRKLKVITLHVGKEMNTEIAYSYLEGSVDPEVLKEFENRIEKIKEKDVLETSYIEELIEDSTFSPFPQFRYTERPDVTAAALLDGKIVVMVHGTSSVLICPALYLELFQSVEDYYQRTIITSMIRLMRFLAVIIALTLPSIYIALSTFHPEMIPTVLLLAVINTREGIPFPALLEAFIMVFFFELMREAGVRMPKPIGQAVSIVGALIIGEAAIQAGIASPIMVVVVALTGISSFAIPQYNLGIAYRILQYPLMILAATLGGFGVMIGLLMILLHLCSLRPLGVPYLAPFAPLRPKRLGDAFIRVPLKNLLKSPRNQHMHRLPKN